MKARIAALALAVGALMGTSAHGALVISEVVFNEVSSDTAGEWIELFNNGSAAIDLTNYKIGDEETSGATGTGEAMHRFPAGASIAPGEIQIVAVSAARFFEVYGVLPTYEADDTDASVPNLSIYSEWDSDGTRFNMANTNDQVLILDGDDNLVDAASWGNTFAFDPALTSVADGQSWERINVYVDTDTAADWQLGPNPDGSAAAQRSTPFAVNVPEPASLGLLGLAGAMLATRRRRA